MKSLKDILGEVVGRYRWSPAEELLEIQAAWTVALTPELAQVTRPVGYLDGALTVAVPSPVWTQELSYWRPELMARINAELEKPSVTRIRFVVRALPPSRGPIDLARLRDLTAPDQGQDQ
jgi:predicted nucleic acid-binding Zn ribbon protein